MSLLRQTQCRKHPAIVYTTVARTETSAAFLLGHRIAVGQQLLKKRRVRAKTAPDVMMTAAGTDQEAETNHWQTSTSRCGDTHHRMRTSCEGDGALAATGGGTPKQSNRRYCSRKKRNHLMHAASGDATRILTRDQRRWPLFLAETITMCATKSWTPSHTEMKA